MTQENKLHPALTDELKKKLQAQIKLGIQNEFLHFTKSPKGRFNYALKKEVIQAMKPIKDEIGLTTNSQKTTF
jgi:hypothetical protein